MKNKILAALAALALLASAAARAQGNGNDAEVQAAFEAARKVKVDGPATVPVRDQASLKIGPGQAFVPTPEAARVLAAMGNRTDDTLVGVVFPMQDARWMAVVKFVKEGYVADDEAKDWKADELLDNLRKGTEAANAERTKRGIPPMEVVGWAEPPRYDSATHRLVWSASTRPKGSNATSGLGVNYNTYALGREGYVSLNLVTDLATLDQDRPVALALLGGMDYQPGKRYADFNKSTDKVAAYGLAALVAGVAAKKLGLFALALGLLAKFGKAIAIAVAGGAWGARKFFRRKASEPVATRIDPSGPATVLPGSKPPGAV
jgi:uncharacterized membrane-anchored protein